MKAWMAATVVGIVIGVVYALSPLTACFGIAMWALHRYATSGLEADERRWMTALLAAAVALRLAALATLFVTTNHAHTPFGIFFGDEEFYIRRSIWLRNVALNVPIHSADLIYAFDESGWTSHLYVLAFLEVLVGPSPYGVHLSGVAVYLLARGHAVPHGSPIVRDRAGVPVADRAVFSPEPVRVVDIRPQGAVVFSADGVVPLHVARDRACAGLGEAARRGRGACGDDRGAWHGPRGRRAR